MQMKVFTSSYKVFIIFPQFSHLQACNIPKLEMITISENCACPSVEWSICTNVCSIYEWCFRISIKISDGWSSI